jgi:hypothetical protein
MKWIVEVFIIVIILLDVNLKSPIKMNFPIFNSRPGGGTPNPGCHPTG